MTPLSLSNRWTNPSNNLRIRWAQAVDQGVTATRIESLLRRHGAPMAYEVFDRQFCLCAPELPDVAGDPDIALVLGEAEFKLFFVAQRERGGLGSISIHEAVHDAIRDFSWPIDRR